jgi:hypothetical protein
VTRPAIEDCLDLWDMSDADIDTVLLRCRNDPILRFEYLRLEAGVDPVPWTLHQSPK